MINKKKVTITIIPIILLLTALFFFLNRDKGVYVLFYNVRENQQEKLLEGLNIENILYDSLKGGKIEFEKLLQDKSYDLIFTNSYHYLSDFQDSLINLDIDLNMASSTIMELGLNRKRYALPIEIDHIELDILKKIPMDNMDFYELEEFYRSKVSKTSFPLVVAGSDDLALLDLLTLLTVSHTGYSGFSKFLENIESKDFLNILDDDLGNGVTTKDLFNILAEWRNRGILHKEWLNFDKETIYSFAKENLTTSIIMRLSEHREYDFDVIQNFQPYKFPTTRDKKFASDISVIPLMAAIPVTSKKTDLMINLINKLINKDFQKELTFFTGLSPIDSKISTLDIQSSDLRFWIASSNRAVPVIYNIEDEYLITFLNKTREYLRSK